jgi:hypothetical protein
MACEFISTSHDTAQRSDTATAPLTKRPNYDIEFWISVDHVFKGLVEKHTGDYDGNPSWRK